MSVKSIVAVTIGVLSMSAGCANARIGDEQADDVATSTVDAPLIGLTRTAFDAPEPLDHPTPMLDLPSLRAPTRPAPTFVPPTLDAMDTGGCYVRYVKIWDPARGHAIDVGVTVCG